MVTSRVTPAGTFESAVEVFVGVDEGLAEVAFGVGVNALALGDGTFYGSELSGNESVTLPRVLGLSK